MADPSSSSSSSSSSNYSYFVTFFFILQLLSACTLHTNGCYTSIISFGDSLADTGNLLQISSKMNHKSFHFFWPPYGETFFNKPTGRCSNGRLVIDFIAESLGLPLVPPFMGNNGSGVMNFKQGVNFAVAGATALDFSFHAARGVRNPLTNASLGVQMEWFKQSLPFICPNSSDCRKIIGDSLVLMGEIGGNDYNHQLIYGKSMDEVQSYVPLVINTIISTVNDLYELGAKTIIIPGNLPIGCSAVYLTIHYGLDNERYDNTTGCLTRLNEFAEYHNEQLQIELNHIRELHPDLKIVYADYYNAAMQIYRSPSKFGFKNGALKACCGGEGPYNFNPKAVCGYPSSTTCTQPDTYVNWDGLHLTEATYKMIYKSVFEGTYSIPQFSSLCVTSTIQKTSGSSSFM